MKRIAFFIILSLLAAPVYAATVELTFTWDKNTETDLADYRLYQSATAGQYTKGLTSTNFLKAVVVSGTTHSNTTTQQMVGAEGQKVYFVLTAYDTSGNESGFSNEVSYTFPDTTAPQPPKNFVANLLRIIQAVLDWFKGNLKIS